MVSYSIFVAHSINEKDMGVLENIKEGLPADVNVYVAEWDPQPGKRLTSRIEEQIRKSDALLAILTKRGARSEWVNQEIGFARAHNKLIIPIKEKGVDEKGFINGLEWVDIDLRTPQEAVDKVNEYLKKIVHKKIEEERLRQHAQAESDFWAAVALATIAVVVIIFIGLIASKK